MAIRRFGEILRATVRASDLAARYGGEEFAVLFPETGSRPALAVADRVRRALERERFVSEGKPFQVTVSAGVADTHGLLEDERGQLLFRADKALYAAKDEGRNRARLWTERAGVSRGARSSPSGSAGRCARVGSRNRDERRPAARRDGSHEARDRVRLRPRPGAHPRVAGRARRACGRAPARAARSGSSGASRSSRRPRRREQGRDTGPSQSRQRGARPSRLPHRRRASGRDQASRSATPSASGRGAETIPVSPSLHELERAARRPRSSGPAFPDRNASSGT